MPFQYFWLKNGIGKNYPIGFYILFSLWEFNIKNILLTSLKNIFVSDKQYCQGVLSIRQICPSDKQIFYCKLHLLSWKSRCVFTFVCIISYPNSESSNHLHTSQETTQPILLLLCWFCGEDFNKIQQWFCHYRALTTQENEKIKSK